MWTCTKTIWIKFIHPSRPSDAYMRQWPMLLLVKMMACSLFSTHPLLHYLYQCWRIRHWTTTNSGIWIKIQQFQYREMCLKKYRRQDGGHFHLCLSVLSSDIHVAAINHQAYSVMSEWYQNESLGTAFVVKDCKILQLIYHQMIIMGDHDTSSATLTFAIIRVSLLSGPV